VPKTLNWVLSDDKPKLDFIDHYYTDKGYIQSLALSVVEHQEQHGKPDLIVSSVDAVVVSEYCGKSGKTTIFSQP
jgi:protoheme ferro-lyase